MLVLAPTGDHVDDLQTAPHHLGVDRHRGGAGARMPRAGFVFDGVTVQRAKRAGRLIQRQPAVFTTAQVAAIAAAAERILPPMIDV